MENEVNSILRQAIILAIIALIIGVCWITIACGQHLYRSFNNSINNSISYAYSSEIDSIRTYHGDLPASSIYFALEKNKDCINKISGYAYGITVYAIEDLKELFQYQLNCNITKKNGIYDIEIKP
ncbi:hypothetical protein AN1V17_03340 [Vallitalea sediminicola]